MDLSWQGKQCYKYSFTWTGREPQRTQIPMCQNVQVRTVRNPVHLWFLDKQGKTGGKMKNPTSTHQILAYLSYNICWHIMKPYLFWTLSNQHQDYLLLAEHKQRWELFWSFFSSKAAPALHWATNTRVTGNAWNISESSRHRSGHVLVLNTF